MFDQLFNCHETVVRHQSAPLLEARIRYLQHCGEVGSPRGTLRRKLADFARLRDETVPTAFDQYWDHPTFVTYNYFLARVGAEPELPKGRLKSRSRGARLPEEVASAVRGRVPPRFKL